MLAVHTNIQKVTVNSNISSSKAAYSCKVTILEFNLQNSQLNFSVKIENTGSMPWVTGNLKANPRHFFGIRLWDVFAEELVLEQQRCIPKEAVLPGEQFEMSHQIDLSRQENGDYELQLDVLKAGEHWFHNLHGELFSRVVYHYATEEIGE